MAVVELSALARADMEDIWFVVASRAGIGLADKIIDRIERRCAMLGKNPEMGPGRDDIARGARCLIAERWLVLYRVHQGRVEIARIVDGARDLQHISLETQSK